MPQLIAPPQSPLRGRIDNQATLVAATAGLLLITAIASPSFAAEAEPLAQKAQAATSEFPDDAVYVSSITNRAGVPLRWMHSNCVFLRANTAGSADIDDGSDLAAIESAVDQWHSTTADCSYLRVQLREPSPDAISHYDNDGPNESVVQWVESGWRHADEAAGLTILFFIDDASSDQDGRILDADIELNGSFPFTTSGESGATDVENTVVHELGHLFGLDHTCHDGARLPQPKDNFGRTIPSCFGHRLPPNYDDDLPDYVTEPTMYNFSLPGETKKRSPELGDIRGICETYPIDDDPGVCQAVNPANNKGGSGCAMAAVRPRPAAGLLELGALLVICLWGLRRRRAPPTARP